MNWRDFLGIKHINKRQQNPRRVSEPLRERTPEITLTHHTNYIQENTPIIHMISGGTMLGETQTEIIVNMQMGSVRGKYLRLKNISPGSMPPSLFKGKILG
jgi:hypothetical protein